jgi:hypothetical protein
MRKDMKFVKDMKMVKNITVKVRECTTNPNIMTRWLNTL